MLPIKIINMQFLKTISNRFVRLFAIDPEFVFIIEFKSNWVFGSHSTIYHAILDHDVGIFYWTYEKWNIFAFYDAIILIKTSKNGNNILFIA